jgi:hypothetical protein
VLNACFLLVFGLEAIADFAPSIIRHANARFVPF